MTVRKKVCKRVMGQRGGGVGWICTRSQEPEFDDEFDLGERERMRSSKSCKPASLSH